MTDSSGTNRNGTHVKTEGVFVKKRLVASAAALTFLTLPSVVSAQPIAITLCVNGSNVKSFLELKGAVETDYVFELSGYIVREKTILIDGTALLRLSDSSLRFGFTLQNSMDGYGAVNWEFVTNLSLVGSGTARVLVATEDIHPLTVAPGICPASAIIDTAVVGMLATGKLPN